MTKPRSSRADRRPSRHGAACRVALTLLVSLAVGAGCSRQERRLSEPGLLGSTKIAAEGRPGAGAPEHRYLANAWSLSEGQRYFDWFNCGGCHGGGGGGGIGPALTDASWRYGGSIRDVHSTISEGRPNGMPAFGERVPDYVIWQIASYVVSLSGRAPLDVAPGRSDAIALGPPPAMKSPLHPERIGEVPR